MKKCTLILFVAIFSFLEAKIDDKINDKIEMFVTNFIEQIEYKIENENVVSLGNVSDQHLKSILEEKITASNSLKLLAKDELAHLQRESLSQNTPSFETKPKAGKFKASFILINGNSDVEKEPSRLGTKSIFSYELEAMNTESGLYYAKSNFVDETNSYQRIILYSVISIITIILSFLLNIFTKGYYHKIVFFLMLIANLFIWILFSI